MESGETKMCKLMKNLLIQGVVGFEFKGEDLTIGKEKILGG